MTYICIFFLFLLSKISILEASAWTLNPNESYFSIEGLYTTDEIIRYADIAKYNEFYESFNYKLYLEYGLIDRFTIGGYLKNFQFKSYSKTNNSKDKKSAKNNYFGNIFFIYNFYNSGKNLLSLKYSSYFPIKYENFTKNINKAETVTAQELVLLFGRSDYIDFYNLNYFINAEFSYKYFNIVANYISLELTTGFSLNDSSVFSFQYRFQYDMEKIDNYYRSDHSQFKIMLTTKHLDNLNVELSFIHSIFKNSNSNSIGIAFIMKR